MFSVLQPVRDGLGQRVADVHLRVGGPGRRPAALQHPGHHQGRRERAAGRHARPGQLWQRADGEPG